VKICLLLSTFAYDGIKRSVVHFANTMDAMGHEVWVGVLHEWTGKLSLRSELRIPAERVVSWDGLGQGRREWAMYRFFRKHRFDVVHANTVKMNHVGRWMALAARVPCVVASEDNLCLNRSLRTRAEDRLLARLSGDRERDVDEALRVRVIQRLRLVKAPVSWVRMVEEIVELDEADASRVFGEALPPGLRLVG